MEIGRVGFSLRREMIQAQWRETKEAWAALFSRHGHLEFGLIARKRLSVRAKHS